MSRSIASVLKRKYLLVLGLIFAASVAAFFIFQQLLGSQVSVPVINEAGRQRMLTQRIALYATLLVDPNSPYASDDARRELEIAAAHLVAVHTYLRAYHREHLLPAHGFRDAADARHAAQLERLEPLIHDLAEDARRLTELDVSDPAARTLAGEIVLHVDQVVLPELDASVANFERKGLERSRQLFTFAVIGEILTILMLIFSARQIFRPMVMEIDRRVRETEHLQKYYRAIINNVGDGVAAFDERLTIQFANAPFAAMVRARPDDLAGRRLEDTLPALAHLGDLFTLPSRRTELVQDEARGAPRIFDVSADRFDFDGDRQCIVSLRDITERKDLENRLRTFFFGIEHSPLSIFITDTKGVIQYANARCVETSGFDLGEIIGSTPRLFRSGQTPPEVYEALWKALLAGEKWYGEVLNRRKNGELYWEFEAISAVKNDAGEITHFIAIKEDVTERKRFAAALVEAKLQADLANRAKSEFLANMSHELRTPLNAIIGFGEVMKSELFGSLGSPKYVEYASTIYDSARDLLQMINDILDYSKLEAGRVTLAEEAVDLLDLARSVLRIVQERADRQGLTLTVGNEAEVCAALPSVYVDPVRYKQILLNILSNAIKFTPAGGRVSLTARLQADGRMAMIVADTGIGIKEQDIPRAMERFGQIESTYARRYEGTGLGLPISKSLIELHGGTLHLASREGEGTTVTITLPPSRVLRDPPAREKAPVTPDAEQGNA